MRLLRIALIVIAASTVVAIWWARQQNPPPPKEALAPIEHLLEGGARLLFVCAHPADLLFAAPLLAHAGDRCLVLTLGHETEELRSACRELGVRFEAAGFPTEPAAPGEPRVRRQDLKNLVVSKWARDGRDPREPIKSAISKFRPHILLTFDVDQGMTGDKEHRAVAELALAAFEETDEPLRLYCVVNRFPKMLEPPPPTIPRSQVVEIVSARRELQGGGSAYEKARAALRALQGSREAQMFTDEQWELLLRETALIVAAQR